MRVFWAGILMTGLLLIGLSTYEGQQVTDEQPGMVTAAEDGTPIPDPYPTSPPKKLN